MHKTGGTRWTESMSCNLSVRFRSVNSALRTFLKRATATMGSAVAANMLLAACQPIRPETPPPVVEEAAADAGAALSSAEGIIAGTVEYPMLTARP